MGWDRKLGKINDPIGTPMEKEVYSTNSSIGTAICWKIKTLNLREKYIKWK